MRSFLSESKKYFFYLSLIVFLGAFLRIFNLGVIPIFGDEAIYIRWSQVMRAEPTLRFLPLSDGKQPLFMWLTIPFLKMISDPLIAGRMLSVTAGLGSLIGIFVLTKILSGSWKASLVASFIYSISPFSVFFDRFALADSLLSFFGIWVFIFSVITFKKVRLDTAMLTGFSLGGALLTKSPAIFFSALIPASAIVHVWPKKFKEKFNRLSVFVFLFSFTYAIGLGIYNVLRLGPNFHMIALRNKDYIYPFSHFLESPFDPFLPFIDRNMEYLWILGPSLLVLLILGGIYIGLKEKRKETLVLFVWVLLPILASSEFSKTMTARYVYFSIPYLFIISSLAFLKDKSNFNKIFTLAFLIFSIQAILADFQLLTNPQAANLPRSERSGYLEEWTSGYGIKEVSDYIKLEHLKNPSQKIIVGTEGFFGTLPDAMQAYLNEYPDVTVIGVGQPIKDLPESLKESKKAGNTTYFVINSTRFTGDTASQNLKLIASYDKAVRPDGSRERLLFFELK